MDKSVDVTSAQFRANITSGLGRAYTDALMRVNSLFYQTRLDSTRALVDNMTNSTGTATTNGTSSSDVAAPSSGGGAIQVLLHNIEKTSMSNAQNTKDLVNVTYLIATNGGSELVPSDYAADAINLLDEQEMALYLNHDVDELGYVGSMPRDSASSVNSYLWVIGAVIGPIAFLVIVFWIVCFVYYKCISPRNNKSSPSDDKSDGQMRAGKISPTLQQQLQQQQRNDDDKKTQANPASAPRPVAPKTRTRAQRALRSLDERGPSQEDRAAMSDGDLLAETRKDKKLQQDELENLMEMEKKSKCILAHRFF